ncbi:MAG: protoglobin family protein [Chloroflexi bacterium]|nr:protoglobin family protein [Chloroflexota bacterium]MDA1219096.1 protoglobin family protein [Chloroflexota bacterium]PKB57625.1 MAG: hypothetical protein BZY73_02215 [SAR202 cluster bacterium Casp-Chloro-G3]
MSNRSYVPGIVDWPARMREMVEFVGLTPDELELVQSTGPILLAHADELTSAIYDHFLKFPESRQFFLTEDGAVDPERIDRRKHSLARWLQASIDFRIDEEFPVFLLAIGLSHGHPPTHRAHLGSVPARFMIGTISFAQTALAQLLNQDMDDPAAAMRASVAWNKLLMVQLDVLLAGYVTEQPIAPAAESPHS